MACETYVLLGSCQSYTLTESCKTAAMKKLSTFSLNFMGRISPYSTQPW